MSTKTRCSLPGCDRPTRHRDGRCPDHRRASYDQSVSYRRVVTTGGYEPWVVMPTPPAPTEGVFDEIHRAFGATHREDGPSVIYRYSDGSVKVEEWFSEGMKHRIGAPAEVGYDATGAIEHEEWIREGYPHRTDGPGKTVYANGVVVSEEWFLHGDRGRYDGPAFLRYSPDGEVVLSEWALHGGYLEDGFDDVLEILGRMSPMRFREALETTAFYRDLLAEHAGDEEAFLDSIVGAIDGGVRTFDGIREVLDGAPAEWVRSFESGRS